LNQRTTRRAVLGIILAAALIVAALYYRARSSGNRLDVDPHAAGEIEKAKHR